MGWFQGRSEHGPRALGSRSIFMSPSKAENKDVLNRRVKHREPWRPFAGIIPEESVNEYFEEGFSTPHMLYSQTVKSDLIPAITHADGTCRIQTLRKSWNPRLHELLTTLDPPVVVNTSFNDNGEPIIEFNNVISTLKPLSSRNLLFCRRGSNLSISNSEADRFRFLLVVLFSTAL